MGVPLSLVGIDTDPSSRLIVLGGAATNDARVKSLEEHSIFTTTALFLLCLVDVALVVAGLAVLLL